MITMTSLGWWSFGVASALVPSVVAVLVLFLHARRFPPVRGSSDAQLPGYVRTWQCSDCLQLWESRVTQCPACRGTAIRLVRGPWSKRHIELYPPSEKREHEG